MRGAFVVQLGPETKPAEGRFEGLVQEVDSCTELRFRSSEELLKFLKAHETEGRVGIYDLEVFRAIDQARARLQKADKDLETLRNELSFKEEQANLGR